jgi:hypothetical protein
VPLQLWLGAGNWDTAATAKGYGELPSGAQLTFEADQKPKATYPFPTSAASR